MISVFIASPFPLIRIGLQSLLQKDKELKVAGETGDGQEAVRLVGRLQPDLVVVDQRLPRLSGLDLLPLVPKQAPQTRSLFLASNADETLIVEAFRLGAAGCLLVSCEPQHILFALHEVAAGRHYLGPLLARRNLNAYLQQAHAGGIDPHETLTRRERQVLLLVAEGNTNVEAARQLNVSARTVEMHRANLMRKLHLQNTAQLIRYALRRGIIQQ